MTNGANAVLLEIGRNSERWKKLMSLIDNSGFAALLWRHEGTSYIYFGKDKFVGEDLNSAIDSIEESV